MEHLMYLLTNDIGALFKIILSDIVLSVDNALVIAMVCAGLKQEYQGTAMKWGMSVAVLARIVFLLFAFLLVSIPLLKLIGGLWLVKLGYDMFKGGEEDDNVTHKATLMGAIGAIVLADVAMSLDNVLAVVGASGEGTEIIYSFTWFGHLFTITDSFPVAIVGVLISIPILLFASKGLMKLIEKFPILNELGALLITFVGVEMALKDKFVAEHLSINDWSNLAVTIISVVITLVFGAIFKGLCGSKNGK